MSLKYNGIYIPPANTGKFTSIPYINDEDNDILILFILYPGSFLDAYNFAVKLEIQHIIIIPMSMQILYCGEIELLQNKLFSTKKSVQVVFPDDINEDLFNITFTDNYLKIDSLSSNNYSINIIEDVYTDTEKYGKLKDLKITVDDKCYYLSNGIDLEKYKTLDADPGINEIHLPYKTEFNNLLDFDAIMRDVSLRPFRSKIKCNAFKNEFDWNIFRNIHVYYDSGKYVDIETIQWGLI